MVAAAEAFNDSARPRHGDGHPLALGNRLLGEAVALVADEHGAGALGEVHLCHRQSGAVRHRGQQPEALPPQPGENSPWRERSRESPRRNTAPIEARSALGERGSQQSPSRTDPPNAKGLRRAQDGAQVARVLQILQHRAGAAPGGVPGQQPLGPPALAENPLGALGGGQQPRHVVGHQVALAGALQHGLQVAGVLLQGLGRDKAAQHLYARAGRVLAQAGPLAEELPPGRPAPRRRKAARPPPAPSCSGGW